MDYVLLWFIMLGGNSGYQPPMEVRNPPCGIAGEVTGLGIDREVNPTTVTWPDPYFPGAHCEIDIRAKVATLAPCPDPLTACYELATTEVGKVVDFGSISSAVPYRGIDPHIKGFMLRTTPPGTLIPSTPVKMRIVIPPPPAADRR